MSQPDHNNMDKFCRASQSDQPPVVTIIDPPVRYDVDAGEENTDVFSSPHPVPEDTCPNGNKLDSSAGPADETDSTGRIKPRDLCVITRQLATLLHAGMPLVPALAAITEQLQVPGKNTHANLKAQIIQQITDRVRNGASLADALRKHPGTFSNLFINMVYAGETGGVLEEVLVKLADMLEKRTRLIGKVKAALTYPALMTVAAVGVVIFLMAFVVPGIANIFLDMNHSLPWPTTMLICISTFLKTYLLLIVIIVCIFIFAVGSYLKTETGKMKWDRFKLKLPLAGQLFLKIETIRLTRTLGIMISSGIPILEALDIAKGVVQNSFIAAAMNDLADNIGKGNAIADSIKKTGLFPPIIYHTISIGEMSGNVDEQLINIAQVYDNEIELTVRSLTSVIEPAVLLIMGLVVGFIVLAMLLPIFEINQMI